MLFFYVLVGEGRREGQIGDKEREREREREREGGREKKREIN